jgi:hypothetical protein
MYRSLGSIFVIGTNVPLFPQVELDVPVEQMANRAVKSQMPMIAGLALVAAFVGSVAANLIVPGRR